MLYKANFLTEDVMNQYENLMKVSDRKIMVESCGLVIDHKNYVLAATPDGKVTDLNAENIYGILEVKCSEEYRDVDPKDVCFVAKEPCILYDSNTTKICLNEKHSYYDQIQMQLALTTRGWCDFVFYISKGLTVDRIRFNPAHWVKLRKKFCHFIFTIS